MYLIELIVLFAGKPLNVFMKDGIDESLRLRILKMLEPNAYILIDEVSMADTILLGKIDQRLRQVTGIDSPFGGYHCILMGDLFQLDPCSGNPIYKDVLTYYGIRDYWHEVNTPRARGSMLLGSFLFINMIEQVRSQNDEEQTEFVENMRRFDSASPIDDDFLENMVNNNTLSATNFEDDGSGETFIDTAVCVTSNPERHTLTPLLAKRYDLLSQCFVFQSTRIIILLIDDFCCCGRFGSFYGYPVITWRKPADISKKRRGGGALNRILQDELYAQQVYSLDSGLVDFFVYNAPAHITENVCPEIGIANGTPCRLHSLSFADSLSSSQLQAIQHRIDAAKPGEIIDLGDTMPEYVNVKVEVSSKWAAEDTLVPLEQDKDGKRFAVIPIGLARFNKDYNIPNSKAKLKVKEHRISVSFAITVNKLQGKTMKRIILQLNQRKGKKLKKITYNGFLVAMSRCTSRKGIRIVPVKNGWKALRYLQDLRPHPDLQVFLEGIDPVTHRWVPQRSKEQAEKLDKLPSNKTKSKRQRTQNVKKNSKRASNVSPSASGSKRLVSPSASGSKRSLSTTSASTRGAKTNSKKLKIDNNSSVGSEYEEAPIYVPRPWELSLQHQQQMEQFIDENCALQAISPTLFHGVMHENNPFAVDCEQVKTLYGNTWLSGSIITSFIQCHTVQLCTTLSDDFYTYLVCPQYRFNAIQNFMVSWTMDTFQRDILIPIHVNGNHWILAILSLRLRTIIIADGYRHRYPIIEQNLLRWYSDACSSFNIICDVQSWTIISGQNLPSSLPSQTDTTSCGVFVCMFAYYWLREQRLPVSSDFHQRNRNHLRLYIANCIYDSNLQFL